MRGPTYCAGYPHANLFCPCAAWGLYGSTEHLFFRCDVCGFAQQSPCADKVDPAVCTSCGHHPNTVFCPGGCGCNCHEPFMYAGKFEIISWNVNKA
jgi:hypothetical protein